MSQRMPDGHSWAANSEFCTCVTRNRYSAKFGMTRRPTIPQESGFCAVCRNNRTIKIGFAAQSIAIDNYLLTMIFLSAYNPPPR